MSNKIIMVKRSDLYVMAENHRQDGARKIIGLEWLEDTTPLVVGMKDSDGKRPIFDGARRYKYLSNCDIFPCIESSMPYSTPIERQEAIEKHKGNSLALSLAQVVEFGKDKCKWNLGRYLAKDGESLFLNGMANFYEDYHPSNVAEVPEGDSKEAKKARTKITNFHKGLSALVYRASMLGDSFAEAYVRKDKGITEALRNAFNTAKNEQLKGLSWEDAKLAALPIFEADLNKAANKPKVEKKEAIDLLALITSIKECAEINGVGKEQAAFIIGHLSNDNGILLQRLATWYPVGK